MSEPGDLPQITFKTEAQKRCYETISPWVLEIYPPPLATLALDHPAIYIALGSTLAGVDVLAFGDDEAAIVVTATVATDSDKSPDLLEFLLSENNKLFFCNFNVDSQGTILLRDTILGSNCSKNELEMSIKTVVEYADHYDDIIVERWSGSRGLDAPVTEET